MNTSRMDHYAVAEFFADLGMYELDEIFEPRVGDDGQVVFGFTDEAVGILGRAIRKDPTLKARLFPRESLH
jgi:hypothetical protein